MPSSIKIWQQNFGVMKVTLNTSALYNIYTGITTVYYVKKENKVQYPRKEMASLEILKSNLASLIDIDSFIFKQEPTLFNSPFIKGYSKDSRDILIVDFSIMGLLLIRKCLKQRLSVLWQYASEVHGDELLINDIYEAISETEAVIVLIQEDMIPLYN